MSQGYWHITDEANKPADPDTDFEPIKHSAVTTRLVCAGTDNVPALPAVEAREAYMEYRTPTPKQVTAWKEWIAIDTRVHRYIHLRVFPSIAQKIRELDYTYEVWKRLTTDHGELGIAAMFIEFQKLINAVIPNDKHPSPYIKEIDRLFFTLEDNNLRLPTQLHALWLVAKAPQYAQIVAQLAIQQSKLTSLSWQNIGQYIVHAWEQKQGCRSQHNQAQHVMAVKRKQADPQFRQQQQQVAPQGNQQQRNSNDEKKKTHRRT